MPAPAQLARALAAPELFSRPLPDQIEIRLDPPELGRVRLSLSLSGPEGALGIVLAADRPETLDLMRRHAADLARELRALGLGEVALDFGAGDSRQGPAAPPLLPEGAPVPDGPAEPLLTTGAPLPASSAGPGPGRLDRRL